MDNNSNLINLLQEEMQSDLSDINISIEDEASISLALVYEWYIEAEKLIRVFANVLGVPMWQAINQLRYAGHHILKSQLDSNGRQQNLIESYKHCKRSVYDCLDFYVYTLNSRYSTVLPLIHQADAIKVETLLKNHINEVNEIRLQCGQRIEYYKNIKNLIKKGLDLIENLNEIQRKSGITENLLKEKRTLINEIEQLKMQLQNASRKSKK